MYLSCSYSFLSQVLNYSLSRVFICPLLSPCLSELQPVNAVNTKGQSFRASFGKSPRFQIQLDKRPLSGNHPNVQQQETSWYNHEQLLFPYFKSYRSAYDGECSIFCLQDTCYFYRQLSPHMSLKVKTLQIKPPLYRSVSISGEKRLHEVT